MSATDNSRRSRLRKVLKELFCMPVIIDCNCEECKPVGFLELDSSTFSESEMVVTPVSSLVSLMEDATQDNVEISLPKKGKGKGRRIAKAIKNFFCMPVVIDCSCEECNPTESLELDFQSFGGDSEELFTGETSFLSFIEYARPEYVEIAPKGGKWRRIVKAIKNFICMPVEINCSCEECKVRLPEL